MQTQKRVNLDDTAPKSHGLLESKLKGRILPLGVTRDFATATADEKFRVHELPPSGLLTKAQA